MRALVTGGTGRVGSAISERLRAEGWSVFAAGRVDGDLADADAAHRLVDRAAGELGGLDLLVNAAGEGFTPKPVDEVTEADWDAALGATAKGSFFVTQAAAARLREAEGVVVMIEDVAAYEPWPSFAPHSAAKAAQAMLTRVFARALAPEVRVCGIAPGPVAVEPGQEERRAGGDAPRPDRHARRRRGRRPLPRRSILRDRRQPRPRRGPDAAIHTASGGVELVTKTMSAELALSTGLPGQSLLATIWAVEPATDGELISRVGEGDSGAFELLYQRYARPVFALALRRLGDRGRAEDAVQETFTSIWRSAKSYRSDRGPGAPWLYAVARNAIVDRRRALGPVPAEPVDEPSNDAGPDERAEASWTAWRVHRALAELPEQERKLIELAYWGGLSQSEIADFVGIPLGTVKTRTRSALSRLADVLEGELS